MNLKLQACLSIAVLSLALGGHTLTAQTSAFVPPAAAAKRLGYQPTTEKVMTNFPERVRDKRAAFLDAKFLTLSDLHLNELPGVTLESNGLLSRLDLSEKEKWVGFNIRDQEGNAFFHLFARKDTHGDLLLSLERGTPVHFFGQVVELDRSGGAVGFIVEAIIRAKPEGIPSAEVDKLLSRKVTTSTPTPATSTPTPATSKSRTWEDLSLQERTDIVSAVNTYNRDVQIWNATTSRTQRISQKNLIFSSHKKVFASYGLNILIHDDVEEDREYVTNVKLFWSDPTKK